MKINSRVRFYSTGDLVLNGSLGTIIGEYGSLWIVLLDVPYAGNLGIVISEWNLEEDDSKIDMKFNCDHTMQPIPWDSKTMGSRYDYLIALKCLKCSIIRTEVERIV